MAKQQKTRFETVPLAEVPDVVTLREPGGVKKMAEKSEPYAVQVERRHSSAGMNNDDFRRPTEGRR